MEHQVLSPFRLQLKAARATKQDIEAFASFTNATTGDEEVVEVYTRLKFASELVKAALDRLQPRVIDAVADGQTDNSLGLAVIHVAGRQSLDYSDLPRWQKAREREQKAITARKAIEKRLADKATPSYGRPTVAVRIP